MDCPPDPGPWGRLTRWDALRFGLLGLAAGASFTALALIPGWPPDEPPPPAPPIWSSWDRRDLPYEMRVGGVVDATRGLTWPGPTIDEPPLVLGPVPGTTPSRVEEPGGGLE